MIEKDKRILKDSGITLLALVVTIIILLVLATLTISMLTSNNSIIERANEAKEVMNEAQVRERVQLEMMASINPETGKLDRKQLKEELKENLGIPEYQIQEDENGNLIFPVEDYDVKIDSDRKVETSKSEGIPTPPQLEEGDITFINEPSKLTNTDVKVAIKININAMRLTLQYTTEDPDTDSSWQTYTDPVTMEDNGLIYARLINANGEKSNYIQGNVNNIDREEPTIIGFEIDKETLDKTSVQVTVTASDDRQLANEDTYKFFTAEETEKQDFKLNGTSTESTYEYTNLIPGNTYTLKVIVTDEAGNTAEKECEQKVIMLKQLPELNESSQGQEGNITFEYSPSVWTNQEVNVKVESELLSEYKLQYSTNYSVDSLQTVTWQEYDQEEGFNIEENGKFAIRLKDDSNPYKEQYGNPIEKEIDWIDKTDPEVMLETSDTTTNSTTINVTATDEEDGSGLTETPYTYYLIEGEVTDPEQVRAQKGTAKEGPTNLSNYTYTGLTQNTKYTLVVDVADVAGNVTTTSTIEKTEEVPDISQEGKLTFKYSKEEWNNDDNVTVTLELGSDLNIDNFDLQYQTPNETNSEWTNYTKQGFQITKNGEINVRVKEKDGEQTGNIATDSYNFFDRNAPKAQINVTQTTKNTLTVQASATEEEEESGLDPTETYKFSIYQGSEIKTGSSPLEEKEASTEEEATFTGLTAGTEYTVRVEAKDNASNIGTADVTTKTEDSTQVGINFVYYDEKTATQKTELVNGAVVEDDGNTQIKSPTVQNVKVNIDGKTITVIPKGWAETENGEQGTQYENGAQIEATEEDKDNGRTFYMIYLYKVAVSVYNEAGEMEEQNIEMIINSKGERIKDANGEIKLVLPENPAFPDEKEDWKLVEWVDQNGTTIEEDKVVPVEGDQYLPKFTREVTVLRYGYDENSQETGRLIKEENGNDLKGTVTAIGKKIIPATVNLKTDNVTNERYRAKQWTTEESTSPKTTNELNSEIEITEDANYYMLYDYDLIATYLYNNNGEGEKIKATTTMNYKGEKVPVEPTTPNANIEGWTFRGWSTESNYKTENKKEKPDAIIQDTIFYASYEKVFVVTTYEYQQTTELEGTAYKDYENQEYGQSLDLNATDSKPNEWLQYGWAISDDLEAEKTIEVNGSSPELTEDTSYYMKYKKEITVSLDLNNGLGDIQNPKGTVYTNYKNQGVKGEELEIPTDTPTRTGYEFVEWENKATGDKYKPSQRYTFIDSIVLTAIWKDTEKPDIKISPMGSTDYKKVQETLVTITDNLELDNSTLKYVWLQSEEQPQDEEFINPLSTSSETVSLREQTGNDWHLWVMAKDTEGNASYKMSDEFYVDNQPPSDTEPEAEATINSIKITFKQEDSISDIDASTKEYGIKEGASGEWRWEKDAADEYTFSKLKPGTEYQVATRADDNASNHTESKPKTISTVNIVAPEITFTPDNGTWTNDPVKVTINYPEVADTYGLTKQYVFNNKASLAWETYTAEKNVTISENETTIYARSLGSNNEGSDIIAEKTATNIDTEFPTKGGLTASGVAIDGTVTLTGKSTDTLSGINAFQFSQQESVTEEDLNWEEVNPPQTVEVEKTKAVTGTGKWYFHTKDQAGNITTQEVNVSEDQYEAMTPVISYETVGKWEKSKKVTISSSINGVTLQYSEENESNYKPYDGQPITVTKNEKIYAKAILNGVEKTTSTEIKDIDNDNPTSLNLTSGKDIDDAGGGVELKGGASDVSSGIKAYMFSQDEGINADSPGWTPLDTAKPSISDIKTYVQKTGTWYFYVKDDVGNFEKTSINVESSYFDSMTPEITFDNSWVSDQVLVTITYPHDSISALKKEYKTTGDYATYTVPIPVTENETIVTAKATLGSVEKIRTTTIGCIDKENPNVKELIETSVTQDSIILNIDAEDNLSGLAKENTYTYFLDDVQQGTSTTESNYYFSNLENEHSYTVGVKVQDSVGNTTEIITKQIETLKSIYKPETWGDYYDIQYSAGGVNDWKIFYANAGYIYLITSDHLNNSLLPEDAGMAASTANNIEDERFYCSYFPTVPTTKISDINKFNTSEIIKRYFMKFTNTSGTQPALMYTAKLLDPDIWQKFVNKNIADEAIGTPTLELFCESWNKRHPELTQITPTIYDGSYSINNGNNISIGTSDSLYTIPSQQHGKFTILASPGEITRDENFLCCVTNAGILTRDAIGHTKIEGSCTIRPVVRLQTNVKVSKRADGTYRLIKEVDPSDQKAPTINSISTKDQKIASITVTVDAQDAETGIPEAGGYAWYIDGRFMATTDTNTYTYTNISRGTGVKHIFTVEVSDKAGNISSKATDEIPFTYKANEVIKPENIGDKINNYTVTPKSGYEIKDWQIYYRDDDYVYLISSNYIPFELFPSETKCVNHTNEYSFYWPEPPTKTINEIAKFNSSQIINRYYTQLTNLAETNVNFKYTAALINPDYWETFVNTQYADEAIGGPPLELLQASWRTKNEQGVPEESSAFKLTGTDKGYSLNNGQASFYIGKGALGEPDSIYALSDTDSRCTAYILPSPIYASNNETGYAVASIDRILRYCKC